MAVDPRYHELLGIDPEIETPPHYFALLELQLSESVEDTITTAFKAKMKKLQQIKSSKHKGFIEMLKEDLRRAKRVLCNNKQRSDYLKQLKQAEEERQAAAQAAVKQKNEDDFRGRVNTVLEFGEITKKSFGILCKKGKELGFDEEACKVIILEMAKAEGVEVNLEDKPAPKVEEKPAPAHTPSRPVQPIRSDSKPVNPTISQGTQRPPLVRPPRTNTNGGTRRPPPAPRPNHPRIKPPSPNKIAPPQTGPLVPSAHISRPSINRGGGGFYGEGGALNTTSFGQGSSPRSVNPYSSGNSYGSGGPIVRPPKPTQSQPLVRPPKPQDDPAYAEKLRSVKETYNRAAKIAKVAIKAHAELSFYFPPKNNKTYISRSLSGITYEKLFGVETKLYSRAKELFEKVKKDVRAHQLQDGLPHNFLDRLERFINSLRNWSRRCRDLKMKLMSGLSKREELQVWNEFIRDPRSNEMTSPLPN